MSVAFSDDKEPGKGVYAIWWIVLLLETIATMGISSAWRMVSFKKTHLVERMGLLTLIVIGEGAIGVTKTISVGNTLLSQVCHTANNIQRMMGKYGLDSEGTGLVLCIILILVAIWMTYFDNHPHGHYGTIRQQIWAVLHFPLHIAIVGVVEGAQQIATARYVFTAAIKFQKSIVQYCSKEHLSGQKLVDKLNDSISYYQLDTKPEGQFWIPRIKSQLQIIGNSTNICKGTFTELEEFPPDLYGLWEFVSAGIYHTLGFKIRLDDDRPVFLIAFTSWRIVYMYFWSAILLLLACFMVSLFLIRRNKADFFDWISLGIRLVVMVISAIILGRAGSMENTLEILWTPVILPVVVVLLSVIIAFDRFGRWFANRRNRASGEPLTGAGHDSHGSHGHGHHENGQKGSSDGSMEPVTHTESYNPLGSGVMPQAYQVTSTPSTYSAQTYVTPSSYGVSYKEPTTYNPAPYIQSPPPVEYQPQSFVSPPPPQVVPGYNGGYAPVSNPSGQY